MADDGWWVDLYDDHLAELLLVGADPEDARRTVGLLEGQGVLRAGDRVFDQGCGTGRLCVPLLEAGAVVEAIDLIPSYVAQAQTACLSTAHASRATCRVGDIHDEVALSPCDLAISWWTCLGYAARDAKNCEPLARAFASLRPGGWFVIDTMNVPSVMRRFRPVVIDTLDRSDGTWTLRRESQLDVEAGVLHKRWIWTAPDGRQRQLPSAVRLYMPHEWSRMLASVGFEVDRMVGDLDGTPLDEDSPRCIVFARRPA